MPLLNIPKRNNVDEKEIIKKTKSTKESTTTIKLGKDSLLSAISNMKAEVESRLGKYKDNYVLVNDKETLKKYIDKILENKICALDTETTGLNCFRDKVVGASFYTPGEKAMYIPLRHISYMSNELLSGNMSITDFKAEISRLENSNVKIIYQNARFDFKMVLNDLQVALPISYDTLLASRALNQMEDADLKFRYAKYVESSDEFNRFSSLFGNIPFQYIPLQCAYIYSAKDAEMTYKLYLYHYVHLHIFPLANFHNF